MFKRNSMHYAAVLLAALAGLVAGPNAALDAIVPQSRNQINLRGASRRDVSRNVLNLCRAAIDKQPDSGHKTGIVRSWKKCRLGDSSGSPILAIGIKEMN
jgi:hypothetical protein